MKKVLTVLLAVLVCMSVFSSPSASGLEIQGSITLNGTYSRENGLKAESVNITAGLDKWFNYSGYLLTYRSFGVNLPLEYDVAAKNLSFSPSIWYKAEECTDISAYGYNLGAYTGYYFSSDKDPSKEGLFAGVAAYYTFLIEDTSLTAGADYEAFVPQSTKTITTSYADIFAVADSTYSDFVISYVYSPLEPEDDGLFVDLSTTDSRYMQGAQSASVTAGIRADFHKVDGEIKKNAGVYAEINYQNYTYPERAFLKFGTNSYVKYNFIRDTADLIEFNLGLRTYYDKYL